MRLKNRRECGVNNREGPRSQVAHYNFADRRAEPLLDYAAAHRIAFIPWFPLSTGALARMALIQSRAGQA
jgi:aryl-alcohol dehydrogenase-like predicted oxidoreductase